MFVYLAIIALGLGLSTLLHTNAPILGNNVWVGYDAIIGGLRLADKIIIGANAMITKTISVPGAIVVGDNKIIGNINDAEHAIKSVRWW